MIRTTLTDLLHIKYPVFNAPMAGSATAELAGAVSNSGGFGMLGMGSTVPDSERLEFQIKRMRDITANPFGVGFITSVDGIDSLVKLAIENKVDLIGHSFSDPSPYIPDAKKAGIKVLAQVQTVEQAIHARDSGVDLLVAQGTDGGGHTGYIGTISIVPAVVDACPGIPVIAAGGITDGRGVAAALALGSSGVWIGSRFVASNEWAGPDWAKQALTEVGADDTIITKSYDLATDAPFPFQIGHRVVRNRFTDKWHQNYVELLERKEDLKTDIALAMENADLTVAPVNAGSGSGSIKSVDNVSEIIINLMDEAESILKNLI
ncbi:MAG: nitronate monooxygenase [Chloroflexota bacterium]|nr:nitronate monooxygenase [Chloroflexota bacterium]